MGGSTADICLAAEFDAPWSIRVTALTITADMQRAPAAGRAPGRVHNEAEAVQLVSESTDAR
jgi:hypothetical protein